MPDSVTIPRLLRQQSAARGDHLLLVCDSDRITYAEADRRSAALARGLVALGAGKGTHIGLIYPNGVPFVVGMLAAARIGAVVVPFSTFATASEIHRQLVHADVEILLAAPSFRSHNYVQRLGELPPSPQLRHRIHDVGHLTDVVDDALFAAMEDDVDVADELAIIYTSGSTGNPKGVVHAHGALLQHQHNLNEIRGLRAQDRLFCNSPFFWIGGFAFGLLATLVAGSTLICSTAVDAGETLDLLEAEKPTLTNGFAAGVGHLARHPSFPDRDLSSMRRGNLYPIVAPDARPADPELRHNMLGMTEAGGVVLLSGDQTDQPEHRRGSFGKPAPGFDTKVVDPDSGQPTMVGELCIRGPYLMQRYYRRSREECFAPDGWFHTGDLVRIDSDGFFYFVGRLDSMIKTAGANVSPTEVEKAIAKVTGGAVSFVVGIPDPQRGQQVAAVVVRGDGGHFDEYALRQQLKSELSAYKIPARFVAVCEVPLLSSGKVDLNQLKKLFDD
ncbi:MAG: class I adenylate-forming enzyme family protein [Candidatus Sericytochromatia bacterium]